MKMRAWRSALSPRQMFALPTRRIAALGVSLLLVSLLLVSLLTAAVLLFRPAPAAHADAPPRRLETFDNYLGTITHRWSDDGGSTWSAWTIVPTPATFPITFIGTPTAVSDSPGRLTVFARDSVGEFSYKTYNNGAWSPAVIWSALPGTDPAFGGGAVQLNHDEYTFISDAAVTSWGPGRMDLFIYARSTLSPTGVSLLHTWATNSIWSGQWEVRGTGSMQGNPSAVSWGAGRIDIFARGGGNELAHEWYDSGNGGWHGWENLGGSLASAPSVASWGPGHLDVFARADTGDLIHKWFLNDQWYSGWQDLGCCLAGDVTNPVATVSQGYPTVDVFVTGTQHDLYRKRWDGSTWSDWQFLDHSLDITDIAAIFWVPFAPVQDPPTPTPDPNCGIAGHPPCRLPQ